MIPVNLWDIYRHLWDSSYPNVPTAAVASLFAFISIFFSSKLIQSSYRQIFLTDPGDKWKVNVKGD